jgi:DeoR/GlpR family transcriptional regulator of sugar metabolism
VNRAANGTVKPIKGTLRTLRVLLELLAADRGRKFLEVQALAVEYGISDQSIYNDLRAISKSGFILVRDGTKYAARVPEVAE